MTQAPLLFDSGRRNLFIEAGAGTGKTTEIVRKVLEILLSDPAQEPDRIVLITFTEKAAGEIAERVRDALIDLSGSFESGRPGWPSGSGEPILAVPPDQVAAWKSACRKHIQQLDRITSQTIHAFCQSILTRFPFEARIDPSFRIVEGFERARILDEIWLQWVDAETGGAISPEREREWELALESLNGVQGAREVLMQLVPHRALLIGEAVPIVGFAESIAPVRRAIDALRALGSSSVDAINDEDARETVLHLRRESPPAFDDPDLWIRYLDPVGEHLREANLRLPRDVKDLFRVLRGASKEENVFDLLESDRAARAILALAHRFLEATEKQKDRRGVVDFDDLLIRTERLLRDPAVARSVRQSIDFLIVDEFQDTDRLQAHIVRRLACSDSGALARGRTILVGDPKQSIYSFRRADPETYGEMLRLFVTSGADTPRLDRQFRSAPELVASLNVMFSSLFSESEETNVFRPSYGELTAGRPRSDPPRAERVHFLRAEAAPARSDEESGSSDRQARAVASWIAARRAAGAPLEEIAILLRKMTDVDPYLDALDRAGIPWVLPRNLSVLERRASVDLLAVLRAIGAPFDRGAEVSAARSPWFGLSDGEIFGGYLASRRARGVNAEDGVSPSPAPAESRLADADATEHDRVETSPPERPPVARAWEDFLAEMRRWRERARTSSVSELIDALVRERRIETMVRLLPRGGEQLADLDAFRELAREFDRHVGGSVGAFAEELLRRRQGGAEGEGAILEQGSAGVRIMTVHASKGLEFGTVILPDLGATTAGDALSVFTLESPSRLFLKGRVKTLGTFLLDAGPRSPEEILKARTEAETDRLFYVAVTRAKEDVVFVVDPEKIAKRSFYKPLLRIFDVDPKAMDPLFPSEPGARAGLVSAGDRAVPVVFERAAPLAAAEQPEAAAGSALEPSLAASGDATLPEETPMPDPATPPDRAALKRAAAAAAQKNAGILLHRALELWEGEPAALEPLVAALGGELAASARDRSRVLERLRRLAGSPHLERLRRAGGGREVTVRFLEEGRAREGRIDRLVREDGSWLVVDYKSGAARPERLERDRDQVARYCRAVAAMTGEPCRAALWYVDLESDEWVEVGA